MSAWFTTNRKSYSIKSRTEDMNCQDSIDEKRQRLHWTYCSWRLYCAFIKESQMYMDTGAANKSSQSKLGYRDMKKGHACLSPTLGDQTEKYYGMLMCKCPFWHVLRGSRMLVQRSYICAGDTNAIYYRWSWAYASALLVDLNTAYTGSVVMPHPWCALAILM